MKTIPSILSRISGLQRTLCVVSLTMIATQAAFAQIPLPIYEPFPASYTNGTADETVSVPASNATTFPARRIRNSPTTAVWSIGGSAGGGSPLAVGGPAALSYPGLYQDPSTPSIGAYVRTNATTANRTAGILFPTLSSDSVYASFLLSVIQNPTTTNRCFVKFETATTGTGSSSGSGAMAGVMITPEGKLALSKSSTTTAGVTNNTVLTAGTHLVVVRYTFNPGVNDDQVDLWLDPGSLNASPGNEPAPAVSLVTGTDIPSISSFYIQAPQTSPPQVPAEFFLDEIRIATNWASVTPTQALCNAASIVVPPANQSVPEGISGNFNVVAGGSSPSYQWQKSTNGGGTWNNVSGANSQSYLTPPTILADSGTRYRVVVSNACDNTVATSSAAILTVTAAVIAPNGIVMDDNFSDAQYNNIPITTNNSVWLQSTAGTLDASSGTELVALSQTNSVTWLSFFTDDSVTNLPVHLDVGRALKATLVFKANNITASNGNFRIGLFDYADGGTRPIADGGTVANSGVNVRGYMTAINFGTTFGNNPFSLYVRNNLVADLMGTTGNYDNISGGPGGYVGAPAFQNGTTYTAEFTITRRAVQAVDFMVNITGGGTNWVYSDTDTNFCYPRFDSIAIRSASASAAADSFEITRLLVEVIPAAVAPPPTPIPLHISASGGNLTLTWTNAQFVLQSAPALTGTFTNVPGATSPYVTQPTGTLKFFRLIYP